VYSVLYNDMRVLICKCEENQAGRAFVVDFLAENGRPRLIVSGLESRCVWGHGSMGYHCE